MPNPHPRLKRGQLTALTLTFTVFCCVSGGPFGLEALLGSTGFGLGLLFILLTPLIWALPDALTSCELAPAIPVEGGYIIWVKRAMGPFFGFLNAWWTWLYTLVDAAIYPVLFTSYLSTLLSGFFGIQALEANPIAKWAVSLIVIAGFTTLNIRGTKLVGQTSSVFAVLLIIPFFVMAVLGFARLLGSDAPSMPSLIPKEVTPQAFSTGLAIAMWNYLGWDALSTVAEEVEDPARAYPRALLIGVPLVTAVYFFPTLAAIAFVPNQEAWQDGAWPEIARAVGGGWLGLWMNIVALISPVALFTASLLASSRVPFVLAEDRFLPKALVDIHPKFGTPWKAILVCGVVYAVLAGQTFQELVSLNVVMYGAALVLETLALLVLRVKEPDLPRPFKIRGGWPVLILILLLPTLLIGLLVVTSVIEEAGGAVTIASVWASQKYTLIALLSGPLMYVSIRAWQRRSVGRGGAQV